LSKDIEAPKNGFAAAENEHRVHALRREVESSLEEVLMMAIHSNIGTKTMHEIDSVLAGGDSYNFRAALLGELNGESANATRRAVNHDVLPSLDVQVVADSLKRRKGRCGDSPSMLEVQWWNRGKGDTIHITAVYSA
jgi:hypothetical protein